jgi:hypothetical protein
MQHNERIIHEPPVIPFADAPAHIRELLGPHDGSNCRDDLEALRQSPCPSRAGDAGIDQISPRL